jgi:hypothetical protein
MKKLQNCWKKVLNPGKKNVLDSANGLLYVTQSTHNAHQLLPMFNQLSADWVYSVSHNTSKIDHLFTYKC